MLIALAMLAGGWIAGALSVMLYAMRADDRSRCARWRSGDRDSRRIL